MRTADEFIDALGGTSEVAKIAGVLPSAVSNWRKIGKLPPRLYLLLSRAAAEQGIDAPDKLFQAHPDPRRARAA